MTYQVIKVSNDCALIEQMLSTEPKARYTICDLLDNDAQSQTNIDDFVFLVLGGDHSKACFRNLNYSNGLKAFAKIISPAIPMLSKPTHYQVEIEITYVFPNTVTKHNFYPYFDLVDIYSIGASTKGEKNQAVSLISLTDFENIIKALIDLGYLNNEDNKMLNYFNISNKQLRKCASSIISV